MAVWQELANQTNRDFTVPTTNISLLPKHRDDGLATVHAFTNGRLDT